MKELVYRRIELVGWIVAILCLIAWVLSVNARLTSMSDRIATLETHLSELCEVISTTIEGQNELAERVFAWEQLDVEATAYSPLDDQSGLSAWGDGSVMASGAKTADVIDKAIAVDPEVIPTGSRVFVEGIGWRTALDTGGSIRGNEIDISMRSYTQAIAFGRREVRLWVRR